MNDAGFTHLDESGAAHMVDVGDKDATRRRAVARCVVAMEATTAAAIADGDVRKGDVLAVARVAGIKAAKRTADIIPLCHPLLLIKVAVDLTPLQSDGGASRATTRCSIGFQPVTLASAYRQDACATLFCGRPGIVRYQFGNEARFEVFALNE